VVRVLIEAGAEINVADRIAGTPLHVAVLRGNETIERLLRKHGATIVTVEPVDAFIPAADAEQGRKTAVSCSVCHPMAKGTGTPKVGPTLWNVVDRQKASVSGFSYSEGMKRQPGVWSYSDLNSFLFYPKGYVPGTRMDHPDIEAPQRRAAFIAYLRTLSEDPAPLP